MTEGERTYQPPSSKLVALVRDHFDLSVDIRGDAWRGEESIGWLASSPAGDRFVQLFPEWRSAEELTWCDRVAEAASSHASACVHAVESREGLRAVATPEGPVMPIRRRSASWRGANRRTGRTASGGYPRRYCLGLGPPERVEARFSQSMDAHSRRSNARRRPQPVGAEGRLARR
jgi:hypothetical protein